MDILTVHYLPHDVAIVTHYTHTVAMTTHTHGVHNSDIQFVVFISAEGCVL